VPAPELEDPPAPSGLARPADAAKPDLVLLHGIGDSSVFFDNLVPRLAEQFTVRAVDLPGHGPKAAPLSDDDASAAAMARALIAELERVGVRSAHLVGFSVGGWVALEMAANGYGRSVVALAPAGLWSRPPLPRSVLGRRLRGAVLRLLDPLLPSLSQRPSFVRRVTRSIGVNPARVSSAQLLGALRSRRDAVGAGAVRRALWQNRFTDGDRITVPVTVAYGDADSLVTGATPAQRSALPAQARWLTVPDCGHAISWDQPELCLRLIKETAALASA
jgi:pimeloyl-ACP methyl ester carboxylesterase